MCWGKQQTLVILIKPVDVSVDTGAFRQEILRTPLKGLKWGASQPVPAGFGSMGVCLKVHLDPRKLTSETFLRCLRSQWDIKSVEVIEETED